jgi:hypothetical protein
MISPWKDSQVAESDRQPHTVPPRDSFKKTFAILLISVGMLRDISPLLLIVLALFS